MTVYIYFEVDRCCGDLHGHPPPKLTDITLMRNIKLLSNNFWVSEGKNIGINELIIDWLLLRLSTYTYIERNSIQIGLIKILSKMGYFFFLELRY
jgi:hypothetical protein